VARINCLINGVHTYPTINEGKTKELNIIQDTLYNNEYSKNLSIIRSRNHKHKKNTSPQHQTIKWAMFTYYGNVRKDITELFKETNIKIVFRTKNTIQNLVKPRLQRDEYKKVAHIK
jgi:hypothetical protein